MVKTLMNSAFIVWRWGDREIEDPKLLRQQLQEIHAKGFSGVVVALWETRYEVIDHKVVVAVAQASQWAKARGMTFWFQADPRQASRSLITQTGERTQNLIVTCTSENGLDPENINLVQVQHQKFNLRYDFPKCQHSHIVQEVSLYFEPSGLERVFMFRMSGGCVVQSSIIDITGMSRLFANMDEGYVEVFGEVSVPADEIWWVMGFPRFDTNLTDFAGRQSREALKDLVEDLFDVSAYIDGITWDNSGYCGDVGRFPVSESIYKAFIAEYGYDLRDVLLALVLEYDDEFHVHVRQDYYNLLMQIVYGAQAELFALFRGFFGEIDNTMPHAWHAGQSLSHDLVCGNVDPWEGLFTQGSGMTLIGRSETMQTGFDSMVSRLILSRSLAVFSNRKRSFTSLSEFDFGSEEAECWTDLMAMFSLHWLVKAYGHEGKFGIPCFQEVIFPTHPLWNKMERLNAKMDHIGELTGYAQPESNVLLVYPVDSITTADFQSAEIMIEAVHALISRLMKAGIQIDVVSPKILKEGRLIQEQLRIRYRLYSAVIYPYPEILDPDVLELITVMQRLGFKILLGGERPFYTTTGKRIPHEFAVCFDPEDNNVSSMISEADLPIIQAPSGSMATKILRGVEAYYMIRPYGVAGSFQGEFIDRNIHFHIPRSETLVIYHRDVNDQIVKLDWQEALSGLGAR
ncbi:hypothetical protein JW835_03100 [bacterium]|nr:hypothetical protein [bacterium]